VRSIRQKKRSSYIKPEYLKQADYKIFFETARSFRDIRKLQVLEIMSLQLPVLLRLEDKNSMHHSVESRLPFIDYRVVETALSLPDKYKIFQGWTKYILRKGIESYLPADIVWRKNKIGFEAPADQWLKEYYGYIIEKIRSSQILNDITDIKKIESLDSVLKWKLFFIAIWEKKFNVTI
jgi:asparagine synthase (glutamine-hydrolysing)